MSNPTQDGGPAFPQHLAFNSNGEAVTPGMYFAEGPGMTLRAYFAAQALMGLLADSDNISSPERNAEAAVVSADALIAELAKGTAQ